MVIELQQMLFILTNLSQFLLLNFWSAEKQNSADDIDVLNRVYKTNHSKVDVISVVLDPSKSGLNQVRKGRDVGYPIVFGTDRHVAQMGNFSTVPVTFFLNKNYNIMDIISGPLNYKVLLDFTVAKQDKKTHPALRFVLP
jgi:hypothetical protein